MMDGGGWDWEVGRKSVCDLRELRKRFTEVHEFVVSPDGESIAAPVLTAPDTFGVCVNGSLWDGEFEKAWPRSSRPTDGCTPWSASTTSGPLPSMASLGSSAGNSPGTRSSAATVRQLPCRSKTTCSTPWR